MNGGEMIYVEFMLAHNIFFLIPECDIADKLNPNSFVTSSRNLKISKLFVSLVEI